MRMRIPRTKEGQPKRVKIESLSATGRQNVTERWVKHGLAEGWLAMADGKLTLKTVDGVPNHEFYIVRPPGRYCCHCDAEVDPGAAALKHVDEAHQGAECPDPQNPAGYRHDLFYALFDASRAKSAEDATTKERQVRLAKWRLWAPKLKGELTNG